MPARRRRRSRWRRMLSRATQPAAVWWFMAALAALATGATVEASLSRAAAAAERFGDLRRVPVVARPVATGQAVPADAVRLEWYPSALIPDGEIAHPAAGRTALAPLVPGEVLLASRLAPDGLEGAAALLPPGMRALAIPPGPGGRPPLSVGDRVDVLATSSDAAHTSVVAGAALVLALDPAADTVTVAVPPHEASVLAGALATAAVTLALTAP